MHWLTRAGEPEHEKCCLRLHPAQHHPQVGEVDLAFRTRRVVLRHEPLRRVPPGLGPHLRPPPGDVVAHRRVRPPVSAVLIDQPSQHPTRGVTLLPRRLQVRAEHRLDRRLEILQHPRRTDQDLPLGRLRRLHRLAHRSPVHPVLLRQLTDRQLLHRASRRIAASNSTLDPTPAPPTITTTTRDHRLVGPSQTVKTAPARRWWGQVEP